MTHHFPDLGSASDWLNQISHAGQPIRSSTKIWVVTRLQYGISVLVSHMSFGEETTSSVVKRRLCFLRLLQTGPRTRMPALLPKHNYNKSQITFVTQATITAYWLKCRVTSSQEGPQFIDSNLIHQSLSLAGFFYLPNAQFNKNTVQKLTQVEEHEYLPTIFALSDKTKSSIIHQGNLPCQ